MSTTVDERVVKMQFDNKQFENGVSQSMSTIDKLKAKLKFKDSAKGLEDVAKTVKKVDMNPLGNAIGTVQAKFSALEVIGVTALANITNSAVNAGKKMISALTIDPIKTGFQEYETQINATQTILANTQKEGADITKVNKALDELNKYADLTIYNFTEMTRNIGTFTAAGVKLDTSVNAIKGIANLAAVSGSTSQQASTAMYQLSQALASGTVKLQDWNSVVNAGMGGQVFQDALKETARIHGIAIDQMIEDEGSFRETLSKGWLTSDILTETLQHFTAFTDDYNEKTLKAQGYTEAQIAEIKKLGETATDAATKVKTFSQLWDVLKEAAQSGWSSSWRVIVGDFEQAKETLTDFSDVLTKLISDSGERRVKILTGVFQDTPFSKVAKRINEVSGATDKVAKATDKASKATKDYGDVVNKVINGEFGDGQERIEKLTKAGYDWAHVQNLVNEKLGNGKRHATDFKESQNELSETEEKLSKTQKTTIDDLIKMSDAELKNIGFTKKEIESFRELQEQSEKTGIPIKKLIKDTEQLSGRALMIDSIKNAAKALMKVCNALGDAWNETFYGTTDEDKIIEAKTKRLYNLIAAIHKFSTYLKVNKDTADKLKRTFKGLFAILDIIRTLTGGILVNAFKLLCKILNIADLDILDVTASVGDMIVKFRDFVKENDFVTKGLKILISWIVKGITWVRNWVNEFMSLPKVQQNIEKLKTAFANTFVDIDDYFQGGIERIKEFMERVSQMDSLTIDNIGEVFKDFRDNVIGYFFDFDGRFEDLKSALREFKENVKSYLSEAGNGIAGFGKKVLEFFKSLKDSIGFAEVFTVGLGVGAISLIKTFNKIGDAIATIAGPFKQISKILNSFNGILKSADKYIKAQTLKVKADALIKFAEAIIIIVGALALLTLLDQDKLKSAVKTLGVVVAGLVGVSVILGALQKVSGTMKSSMSILSMAGAMMILISALKKMEGLDDTKIDKNVKILGILATGLAVIAGVLGKFSPQLSKGSFFLLAFAGSLWIIVNALKSMAKLKMDNIDETMKCLVTAILGMVAVGLACKKVGIGSAVSIIAMVVGLKLLIGVFDDIAEMDAEKIKANIVNLIAIFGSFSALMIASKYAGKNAAKAGVMMLTISASLLLIVAVIKMMSTINKTDLKKATNAISQMMLVFGAVVALSNFAGNNAVKAGAMLLMMSGALVILSGVIVLLTHIKPDGLKRALTAITILETMFGGLMAVTKLAKDCKGTLITLATTVTLLSVALAGLSFIDPENLKTATIALTSIISAFSLLISSTALAKNATKSIVTMTIAVTAIGGILALLACLPVNNTLEIAKGLSVLLMSLSASMVIISNVKGVSSSAYVTLGIMTAVVAGLAVIIGVLAACDVGPTLEIAESLSILLLSLSGACLILSGVGMLGSAGLVGVGVLSAVIVAVGGLMVAIGALMEYVPGMQDFLTTGISVLEQIGNGLGSFFGNIVSGFAESATSGLPDIGKSLSKFAKNASGFFDAIKSVDSKSIEGVKNLAQTILILTAADLIDGIASWFTGESSFEDFGTQIQTFARAMVGYSKIITEGNINEEAVTASANAGKALAELANDIPNSGGVLGWIMGENDIDDFASKIVPFAKAIVEYSSIVAGNVDSEAITSSSNASKALVELASSIPNSGGVLGWIMGENDIDDFASKIVPFGKAIVEYSSIVAGNVNGEAITASANASKTLVELARSIPNTGGVLGWITGDNDIDEFGAKIQSFATSIVRYSNIITSGNGIDSDAIVSSANACSALAVLSKSLPNSGGLVSLFTGDNDIDDFGQNLIRFGKCFLVYANAMKLVDTSTLTKTTNAAKALAELQNALPDDGIFSKDNSLENFGEQLEELGDGFSDYADSVSGIDVGHLSDILEEMKDLVTLAKLMAGVSTNGLNSFAVSLALLAKSGLDEFVKVFENSSEQTDDAVSKLLDNFSDSVESNSTSVRKTFSNLALNGSQAIRSKYLNFYSDGVYLVNGFIKGISDNISKVAKKSAEMAKAAEKAARQELDIHSPSKKFQKIGEYAVEGMGLGVKEGTQGLCEAVSNASKSAENVMMEHVDNMVDSLNYGKGALKEFVKAFNDVSKADASIAISSYAEKLYKNSDQYKEDQNQLKESKKALNDLENSKAKIQEEITKLSNNSYPGLKSQLKDTDDTLVELYNKQDKYNKQIDKYSNITTKSAKATTEALKKQLSETTKSYNKRIDELLAKGDKASKKQAELLQEELATKTNKYKSQIETYSKLTTETAKAKTSELRKQLNEINDSIAKNTEQRKKLQKEISAYTDFDAKKAEKEVKSLKKQITESDKAIKESSEKRVEIQNELDKLNGKTDAKSKKRVKELKAQLKDIDKSIEASYKKRAELQAKQKKLQDEIDKYSTESSKEAKQKLKDLKNDLKETNKAIKDATKQVETDEKAMVDNIKQAYIDMRDSIRDTVSDSLDILNSSLDSQIDLFQKFGSDTEITVAEILENMQSQVDGVTQWNKDLDELAGKGIASGLLEQLRNMGPSGANYVKAFMSMTTEEMEKANEAFNKSSQITAQTLIDNFQSSLDAASKWGENMQELAKTGLDQAILENLGKQGIDSAEYVEAFLNMTPEQIAKVNEMYKESLSLPKEVANQVLSSYAYAGTDAAKSFAAGLSTIVDSEDESEESINSLVQKSLTKTAETLTTSANELGKDLSSSISTGLKSNKSKLVKTASDVGKAALDAIKRYLSYSEGRYIGINVGMGLIAGLNEKRSEIRNAMESLAREAIAAAESVLDINSPSKKFEEIGMYTDMGFANGIRSYAKLVKNSSEDVSNTAIDSVRNVISKIASLSFDDVDTEPTIRPVLDLSNVEKGTRSLNAMFSRTQAVSIASSMNRSGGIQNGNAPGTTTGNTYNLTQNNYSPKALSRIDIYRQTKNQFSALKEVLET